MTIPLRFASLYGGQEVFVSICRWVCKLLKKMVENSTIIQHARARTHTHTQTHTHTHTLSLSLSLPSLSFSLSSSPLSLFLPLSLCLPLCLIRPVRRNDSERMAFYDDLASRKKVRRVASVTSIWETENRYLTASCYHYTDSALRRAVDRAN